MNPGQKETDEPAKLDDHQPQLGVVIVPFKHLADQIRRGHERHCSDGGRFVQDEQGEVLPRNVLHEVIADHRVAQRHPEDHREPAAGGGGYLSASDTTTHHGCCTGEFSTLELDVSYTRTWTDPTILMFDVSVRYHHSS